MSKEYMKLCADFYEEFPKEIPLDGLPPEVLKAIGVAEKLHRNLFETATEDFIKLQQGKHVEPVGAD